MRIKCKIHEQGNGEEGEKGNMEQSKLPEVWRDYDL